MNTGTNRILLLYLERDTRRIPNIKKDKSAHFSVTNNRIYIQDSLFSAACVSNPSDLPSRPQAASIPPARCRPWSPCSQQSGSPQRGRPSRPNSAVWQSPSGACQTHGSGTWAGGDWGVIEQCAMAAVLIVAIFSMLSVHGDLNGKPTT